jgi:murein DD-endopeptidase MepM/ murein hydrolase activator NlpD
VSSLQPVAAQTKPPAAPAQGRRTFFPLAVSNPAAARPEADPNSEMGGQPYVLKPDDDLATLAVELSRDVDLMACVTPSGIYPLDELRPGQTILVPGPRYLCYTVKQSETVTQIAEAHQVTASSIVEIAWNQLQDLDEPLEPGRRLLIFDGVRPERPPQRDTVTAQPTAAPTQLAQPPAEWLKYGDGHFVWPIEGEISQGYSRSHRGLDIAVNWGTPVVAADNGVVVKSGYSSTGYGGRVIIDHNIDYVTLYAHLAQAFVREGDVVRKGQVIGLVGSTGNSTGPHLHFELRDFGYLIDPRRLLPQK